MSDRDEELGSIPSIRLDQDELEGRQLSRSNRTGSLKPEPPLNNAGKRFVPIGWFFLLLVVVAGLGAVSFFLFSELQVTHQSLSSAENRIKGLESKLTTTDSSLTQSEAALVAKIKTIDELIEANESEIRKLWGVSYDRNRKAIGKNTELNESQKKILARLEKEFNRLRQDTSGMIDSIKSVEATSKSAGNLMQEAATRSELIEENLVELENSVGQLAKKFTTSESNADIRLKAIEDSIKSIDVHRRNVNDELRKLKEEIIKNRGVQ